jgi:hypothetical protein
MTHRPGAAVAPAICLAIGLGLGWLFASGAQAPRAHADAEPTHQQPRWEDLEDAVTSGPIAIEHDAGNDIQVARDAIYYLDYRGGRLMAAVPMARQSAGGTRMIDAFAERDLIADFKLTALKRPPHFMMVTATMGNVQGAWAPLYVFETTTKQVATYKVTPLQVGTSSQPRFDLLELRPLPALPAR